MADFYLSHHGTIIIVLPTTTAAKTWVEEHIGEDAQRWGQSGFAVEPRYIGPIVDGITDAGLSVGG